MMNSNGATTKLLSVFLTNTLFLRDVLAACKRKDESPELQPRGLPQQQPQQQHKKPRLVFTDLQRRTLQAIFKVQPHQPSLSRF